MLSEQEINNEFCKEMGIKKACCCLYNKDTGEIRYYTNLSGLYKQPAGWKNILKEKFDSCYPDFINNEFNFCNLLNVQWFLDGQLGDVYKRNGTENFQANYLKTRLKAIKLCKAFGGGEMLEEYKKRVNQLPFQY